MNPIFYTKNKGLTSTKAAFVCDSIKNLLVPIEAKINGLVFYNTSVSIITNPSEKAVTSIGVTSIDGIKDDLELIGRLYGLSAWLREAVKQKDAEITRIKMMTLANWAAEQGISLPVASQPRPVYTEAEVLTSWEPSKVARYYTLEAKSAHYGRTINPDGSIYGAYKALQKILVNPHTQEGKGQDMTICAYEPSIDPEQITRLVEDLRQTKGSYESELNSMKSEIKKEVDRVNLERSAQNREAQTEYFRKLQEVQSEFNTWIIEKTAELSALKISIPENLQPAMEWLKTRQQEIAVE